MVDKDDEYVTEGLFRRKKTDYEREKEQAAGMPPPPKSAADVEKEVKAAAIEDERIRELKKKLDAPTDHNAVFSIPIAALMLHTYFPDVAATSDTGKVFLEPNYNPIRVYQAFNRADGRERRGMFMGILEAQLVETLLLGQIIMSRTLSDAGSDTDEMQKLCDMKLKINSAVQGIIQAHGKLTALPFTSRPQVQVNVNTAGIQNVATKSGGEPPPNPAQNTESSIAH
jgi:hypothetical protein